MSIYDEELIQKIMAEGEIAPQVLHDAVSQKDRAGILLMEIALQRINGDARASAPLSQLLSIVPPDSYEYAYVLISLVQNRKMNQQFSKSVLSQTCNLSENILEIIAPYSHLNAESFIDHAENIGAPIMNDFVEKYLERIFESQDTYNEWLSRMGFPSLASTIIESKRVSAVNKRRINSLLFLWRSAG